MEYIFVSKEIKLKRSIIFFLEMEELAWFPPPPFVKGDNQDLKQDILAVEIFFWNFGGGNKRGWGIQCFPLLLGSCTQHKFSYSCYVIIDYHMIHIFYIFLLPVGSVALSGFRLVFTIDSMQKCEHKVKGKRFSVWGKESFLFLS